MEIDICSLNWTEALSGEDCSERSRRGGWYKTATNWHASAHRFNGINSNAGDLISDTTCSIHPLLSGLTSAQTFFSSLHFSVPEKEYNNDSALVRLCVCKPLSLLNKLFLNSIGQLFQERGMKLSGMVSAEWANQCCGGQTQTLCPELLPGYVGQKNEGKNVWWR